MAAKLLNGQLTGRLSGLAQKRISKERVQLEREQQELEKCGIFSLWGDELHRSIALITGPSGTPYEHGFYFFDVQFSDNYPLQPPHLQFMTGDGRVRFNPNLYVEGKVCLSILGTWHGPSWTSSCTLRTVLMSVQSLLSEHPIQNEPGMENESGKNDAAYSEIIRYENIAVAVVRMLKQTPPKFASFRPQMRQVFLKNYEGYVKTLEALKEKDGTSTYSPVWRFPVKFRCKELIAELRELREKLLEEEAKASGPEAEASASSAADLKRPVADACPNDAAVPPPNKRPRQS
mmetsp:Transcript_84038/g.153879  ORF Transcript_84038/g.153879 Transcript_84038/m.153879 type:complete len:290 (-) Transcript_84038:40-909(-)